MKGHVARVCTNTEPTREVIHMSTTSCLYCHHSINWYHEPYTSVLVISVWFWWAQVVPAYHLSSRISRFGIASAFGAHLPFLCWRLVWSSWFDVMVMVMVMWWWWLVCTAVQSTVCTEIDTTPWWVMSLIRDAPRIATRSMALPGPHRALHPILLIDPCSTHTHTHTPPPPPPPPHAYTRTHTLRYSSYSICVCVCVYIYCMASYSRHCAYFHRKPSTNTTSTFILNWQLAFCSSRTVLQYLYCYIYPYTHTDTHTHTHTHTHWHTDTHDVYVSSLSYSVIYHLSLSSSSLQQMVRGWRCWRWGWFPLEIWIMVMTHGDGDGDGAVMIMVMVMVMMPVMDVFEMVMVMF